MPEHPTSFAGSGTTVIPASFYGTVSLEAGGETPAAPGGSHLRSLPGDFEMTLDIGFALLLELGFVPVPETDPAYPLYLRARDSHDHAPPAGQAEAMLVREGHGPDVVWAPFQTTIALAPELHLRYGLVPPGSARLAAQAEGPGR